MPSVPFSWILFCTNHSKTFTSNSQFLCFIRVQLVVGAFSELQYFWIVQFSSVNCCISQIDTKIIINPFLKKHTNSPPVKYSLNEISPIIDENAKIVCPQHNHHYNQQSQQHYRKMDNHHPEHNCRQISSSEDRCKCPLCKNQLDIQLNCKKPLANIYLYRHLKKRQAPPIKKETTKDVTIKPKNTNKQEQQSKPAATPVKNKQDRSKEANPAIAAQEYHMVSQSQRTKLNKEDHLVVELRREERMKPKVRSIYQGARLAQISQNPQNIKVYNRNTPSADARKVDASPSCVLPFKLDEADKNPHP